MTTDDEAIHPGRRAAAIKRELAMIAELRSLMKQSEGNNFHPPTTVPDRLLDQLNALDDRDDT